ncbi:MAG: hypothetical protein DYH08_13385 [Actinobacteria bacterium ATB1]|nr:hypothetical protein [Actinobacteria bacterium ATB1]
MVRRGRRASGPRTAQFGRLPGAGSGGCRVGLPVPRRQPLQDIRRLAGQPVLLAVEPGGDESHDAWADFLDGLRTRGLRPPLLVISDGAPGLIGAVEAKMSTALRQRCLIHRARNVLAKVPAESGATRSTLRSGRSSTSATTPKRAMPPCAPHKPTSTPSPAATTASSPPP